MRLAVLGAPQSWYISDIIRAATASGDTVVSLPFTKLASSVLGQRASVVSVSDSTEVGLEGFDAVLVRSMPPGSLEQVVFRMDALLQLESQGTLILNSPRSLEASIDKYVATTRLANAGLLVPDTIACQTVEQAMLAFQRLGGDVVLKPIFGSEGRGITRISDEAIAVRIIRSLVQTGCVFYLQRFIPHNGQDLRLFVMGDEVMGIVRRNEDDWRTNVSRGGTAEPVAVTDAMREQALTAAGALGAELAGVDFLDGRDGNRYALEVNAVPGWRALGKALNIDVAHRLLGYIRSRL